MLGAQTISTLTKDPFKDAKDGVWGYAPRMNATQSKQSHYGPKKLACQGTKRETHIKQEESSKSLASFTISFKALMTCWESLSN